jgi:hypothetical protein
MTSVRAALAVVAVMTLSTACDGGGDSEGDGGGPSSRTPIEQYFADFRHAGSDFRPDPSLDCDDLDPAYGLDGGAWDDLRTESLRFNRCLLGPIGEELQDLRAIAPPPELAQAHARWVAEYESLVAGMEDDIVALEAVTSEADYYEYLEVRTKDGVDVDLSNDACWPLEDIARANDISTAFLDCNERR